MLKLTQPLIFVRSKLASKKECPCMLHYTIQKKKHCNLYIHSLTYLKIDFMTFTILLKYTFELRCNIKVSAFQRETIFPLDQLNTKYIYPLISFSTFLKKNYGERKLLSFYRKLKFLSSLTNCFLIFLQILISYHLGLLLISFIFLITT